MAFCQAVEKGKGRCVAYLGHIGNHDFMPHSSTTVRKIVAQEESERKLGWEPTTGSARATESSAKTTPSETTQATAAEPPAAGDPASETSTTTSETPGQ